MDAMNDLTLLAEQHLALARQAEHGRSAHLFLHDGPLRQSVIALVGGAELEEHNAPPAASLHVLRGRVRLRSAAGDIELDAGQVMRIPQARHGLTALDDSVLVLTSVTATPEPVVVYDTRRVRDPA
ncbi:cupin domain-containing protein [Streptomyces litchfieldiae]|uniref:Cupin n=1 Tax=Streptomyces litchfieldiae TaxID=3075543 RepID=A0ABU2MWK2_9ACTN|nr:cupin [Streptomyces sp. DSM 44938]MDT0345218.1 cupin [Streptomyces sp. DSM 44938]